METDKRGVCNAEILANDFLDNILKADACLGDMNRILYKIIKYSEENLEESEQISIDMYEGKIIVCESFSLNEIS